ncbi:MAG: antibiotic biosynthesis monooxygenase [Candidatus Thiodiazotropha sp.]
MSKVKLKGFIVVADNDLEIIEQELPRHCKLTRQEAGCLVFEVTRSHSDHNRFNVYEEFVDREAFDAHQARVKNSKWGSVTANVERHYEIIE